uniref:BZIP domain-containing protein n=1 Tax=Mesocestoides corti TaxID=53468 RepID=A0A5K3EET0_MESCO
MPANYPSDEELVQMTTIQLRNLLEKQVISQEQHRELRTRRRRLQNRKYARRCAKKKQTEVAELAAAAKKESSAIRSLRQQLSRLTTSVDRIDRQIENLAKLRISMSEAPFSLRMLASDGTELGLAHFICRGTAASMSLFGEGESPRRSASRGFCSPQSPSPRTPCLSDTTLVLVPPAGGGVKHFVRSTMSG